MVSFIGFLFIYTLGGITFLPIVALIVYVYIKGGIEPVIATLEQKKVEPVEIVEDSENDIVKKGWIRLTNQYQPKMPELTVNNNSGIISGIQSYVSSGNSSHNGSGGSNGSSKTHFKKGVVYGVLQHGSLFCFESEKQKEVLMVLPIKDYKVSLYAPSFETKVEGEIYNRTTVISLIPNNPEDDVTLKSKQTNTVNPIDSPTVLSDDEITYQPVKTLYLTCARNIDKEDWYFGLLDAHRMCHILPNEEIQYDMIDMSRFDKSALEKLIRQVQSTPSQRETSWLNAMIGRIFLATYKTDQLKKYFETKIRKKIDKTKRPTFLDEIHVRSVDVGESTPYITNPKLLSLTPEGEVVVEAQVDYSGGLTIEIETDFNWSYSSRMKPIRMHLILAVTLKKLEGRMMFKLKAPPTNRCWVGFFETPQMEWKITPVVADKQIKLNIVTNAIESRIREVMGETFVLPNMSDIPFCPSEGKGGIFGEVKRVEVKRTKKKVEPSSNGNNTLKPQRANSSNSVSSSISSSSSKLSSLSNTIRENPTVPETVEKIPASDVLKLKHRGAESVANLHAGSSQHKQSLAPPQKLETSSSTPAMKEPTIDENIEDEKPDVFPLETHVADTGVVPTSSVSSGSKWSKSTYLRRRPKSTVEESDSDTESIKSNHTTSSKLFNKISGLIPSEHHLNSDNVSLSDSVSLRPSNSTTKKQAILNMAGNFLNRRNSKQDKDHSQSNSETKKENYSQKFANIRKRVEDKIVSVKNSESTASVLASAQKLSSKLPAPPPPKPSRRKASVSSSDSIHEKSQSETVHNASFTGKPPLPPRKNSINSIHHTDLDDILITRIPDEQKTKIDNSKPLIDLDDNTLEVSNTIKENNTSTLNSTDQIEPKVMIDSKGVITESPSTSNDSLLVDSNPLTTGNLIESDVLMTDSVKKQSNDNLFVVEAISIESHIDAREEKIPSTASLDEHSNSKIGLVNLSTVTAQADASNTIINTTFDENEIINSTISSPTSLAPPLPATLRPKAQSAEEHKPPLPTVPRPTSQIYQNTEIHKEEAKPPIPPRSPNQQNAVPPSVPPRPH